MNNILKDVNGAPDVYRAGVVPHDADRNPPTPRQRSMRIWTVEALEELIADAQAELQHRDELKRQGQ
jgi:hypothetical protein